MYTVKGLLVVLNHSKDTNSLQEGIAEGRLWAGQWLKQIFIFHNRGRAECKPQFPVSTGGQIHIGPTIV